MFKINLTKETWRHLAHQSGWLWRELPAIVLVRYQQTMNVVLIIGALIMIGVVGARLIISPPELPPQPAALAPELRTAIIDELELWIEDRDALQQRGLPQVRSDMFVTASGR